MQLRAEEKDEISLFAAVFVMRQGLLLQLAPLAVRLGAFFFVLQIQKGKKRLKRK